MLDTISRYGSNLKAYTAKLLQRTISPEGEIIVAHTTMNVASAYNLNRIYDHFSNILDKTDAILSFHYFPNDPFTANFKTSGVSRSDDNKVEITHLYAYLKADEFPEGAFEELLPHVTLPALLLIGDVTVELVGGRVVVKHNKYNVTFNFHPDDK